MLAISRPIRYIGPFQQFLLQKLLVEFISNKNRIFGTKMVVRALIGYCINDVISHEFGNFRCSAPKMLRNTML
jgi:hypothetical protein